ncbi:MAG: tripartite tricarboxylate transporter substrate binding protein [Rhodospirillales bacterium]|nr:tripartite tricarboxylate transporter substrate binding protein [Rhodospirillales bacterium]
MKKVTESNELAPSDSWVEMDRRQVLQGLGAAGAVSMTALAITPGKAEAANWPERPITPVVFSSAGGGTDTIVRALASAMSKNTGWTINTINKPGAVGGVATRFVTSRPDDGYWWLAASNYNKFVRVMGHSTSKTWEDWQFFQAALSLASWSVRPDSKYKTLQDVIDDAKKNPGKISISTSGTGGLWQELALIVSEAAGIKLKYVPYKGGKPSTLAGLNGEVDIAGGGIHEHIEHIRAGKLVNLQHTGSSDIKLPNGTVLKSVGGMIPKLKPLLPVGGIYTVALKRTVSKDILDKIGAAWKDAVASDSFQNIARKKYFEVEVRMGAEADRRAAQVEAITATTFWNQREQIGKKILSPSQLGLPDPADFDKWWPPKGYKPLG